MYGLRCRYCKKSIDYKYIRSKCCVDCRDHHRDKIQRVRYITNILIREGYLSNPDIGCQECGNTQDRLHVHHLTYQRPDKIKWLCPVCHTREHEKLYV